MAKQAALPGAPFDTIPDKLYFRIGEVAQLCGVEAYVLRFWQTEFPQLAPKKSGTGQRLYRRRDVEQAMRIKRLLHEEGYTIAGARQVFATEAREQRNSAKSPQPELPLAPAGETAEGMQAREQAERATGRAMARLARLRQELRELHGLLSQPPADVPGQAARRPEPRSRRGSEGSLFKD